MLALSNALIVVTCVGTLLFCVLYAVLSPWWRYAVGRNVMALMATISLFLVLAVIHLVAPHAFDSWPWIRLVVWSQIAVIVWWRVALLVRTQVAKRRDERPPS
jgi:hypothetical protein